MKDNDRKEIVNMVQKIQEERFLRYVYILLNEMIAKNNK